MATMRLAHSIHLSSLHITRGFDYCDEFDMLGIVGDNVLLLLLPDPVNSPESEKTQIVSQHGVTQLSSVLALQAHQIQVSCLEICVVLLRYMILRPHIYRGPTLNTAIR